MKRHIWDKNKCCIWDSNTYVHTLSRNDGDQKFRQLYFIQFIKQIGCSTCSQNIMNGNFLCYECIMCIHSCWTSISSLSPLQYNDSGKRVPSISNFFQEIFILHRYEKIAFTEWRESCMPLGFNCQVARY
jgi:hypothetical protein